MIARPLSFAQQYWEIWQTTSLRLETFDFEHRESACKTLFIHSSSDHCCSLAPPFCLMLSPSFAHLCNEHADQEPSDAPSEPAYADSPAR